MPDLDKPGTLTIDPGMILVADLGAVRTVQPTPLLRWAVHPGSSVNQPRLQQAWRVLETGETEWREVEYVVISDNSI